MQDLGCVGLMKDDVWKGLEEKLKEKAKTVIIQRTFEPIKDLDYVREKWVRLEDVMQLIEEIKQNYVLLKKPVKGDILKVEELLKK